MEKSILDAVSTGFAQQNKEIALLRETCKRLERELDTERAAKLTWKKRFEVVQANVHKIFAVGIDEADEESGQEIRVAEDPTVVVPAAVPLKSKKKPKGNDLPKRSPARFRQAFKCPDCESVVYPAGGLVSLYAHHRRDFHHGK